jgi:hypothetical protein
MKKFEFDLPTVIVIAVFAMFITGAALIYFVNPYEFDSSAEENGSDVLISVSSNSAVQFSASVFSVTGDTDRPVVFYYDEGYASITGHSYQRWLLDGIERELGLRNFQNGVIVVGADSLKDIMESTDADDMKTVVIMTSGAFPDNVHSSSIDLVSGWVSGGGIIMWTGSQIGHYSAPADSGYNAWLTDPSQPGVSGEIGIFGDQVVRAGDRAHGDIRSEFCDSLSFTFTEITYGMDEEYVKNNGKILGYTSSDGFSSMSFIDIGTGGILVFGGTTDLQYAIPQTLASSAYLWDGGAFQHKRENVKGTVEWTFSAYTDYVVYVYAGTIYPVYGKAYSF